MPGLESSVGGIEQKDETQTVEPQTVEPQTHELQTAEPQTVEQSTDTNNKILHNENVAQVFQTHKEKLLQMYINQRTSKGLGLMVVDISSETAKVGYNLFGQLPIPVQEDLVCRAQKHPVPESIAFFLFVNKNNESLVEYNLYELIDSDSDGKSEGGISLYSDSNSISSTDSSNVVDDSSNVVDDS